MLSRAQAGNYLGCFLTELYLNTDYRMWLPQNSHIMLCSNHPCSNSFCSYIGCQRKPGFPRCFPGTPSRAVGQTEKRQRCVVSLAYVIQNFPKCQVFHFFKNWGRGSWGVEAWCVSECIIVPERICSLDKWKCREAKQRSKYSLPDHMGLRTKWKEKASLGKHLALIRLVLIVVRHD